MGQRHVGWLLALRRRRTVEPPPSQHDTLTRVLIDRWPASISDAIVGVLAMVTYLRVAPLGVTAEISIRAKQVATELALLPPRLEGLDTLRGCIIVGNDLAFSNDGGFVGALAIASFAAAFAVGQFQPTWPTYGQMARSIAGGVLLGCGATIALGCTIGTPLSGVVAARCLVGY